MIDASLDILHDAIARNAAAVISLPSAGVSRHRKTRLLAESDGGIWVGMENEDRALVDELLTSSSPVGVAFMNGPVKVVFATSILARRAEFNINADLQVEAACLRFPDAIKSVQRRSNYRVSIPSNSDLEVRIWRLAQHAMLRDRPTPSLEIKGKIKDLSGGGMAYLYQREADEPAMAMDQRLRIALQYQDFETVMEGRVRYVRVLPDASVRLGIEFKRLQDDFEGRQAMSKLNTIVGQLQRNEVRKLRLGLR